MKRFSTRETAVLMAPVLVMGALGWWASKRPHPSTSEAVDATPHPRFRIEAPSALEAFRGANAAFVVEVKAAPTRDFDLTDASGTLEVQTSRGPETARLNGSGYVPWDRNLCSYTSRNNDSVRYLLRTAAIPAGKAHFGFSGVVQPIPRPLSLSLSTPSPPLLPLKVGEKWPVNRAQFRASNLASWPRQPLVTVREVRVTQVHLVKKAARRVPSSVTGQVIFDLHGAAMNDQTSFDGDFDEHYFVPRYQTTYGISYSTGKSSANPRARVREWTASSDSLSTFIHVSGRASANNRWPLGFEIEPFNFKTIKVGQKLKFKQFPVSLPKS